MVITPYNILRHELIGLFARVAGLSGGDFQFQGQIINETRNTICLDSCGAVKTVPKGSCMLELKLPGNCWVRVDGRLLIARPEDRVKKKYRIKFT